MFLGDVPVRFVFPFWIHEAFVSGPFEKVRGEEDVILICGDGKCDHFVCRVFTFWTCISTSLL